MPVPAYEAMQSDPQLGSRILAILLRGVDAEVRGGVAGDAGDGGGIAVQRQ